MRGIYRSLVGSHHKCQWHGVSTVSSICAWTNGSATNRGAGDLRRHRAHYVVNVMILVSGQFLEKFHKSQSIRSMVVGYSSKNRLHIFFLNTYPVKCGMKLLILSQTSMVAPFGNGWDMLFHPTFYNGCNYLSSTALITRNFVKSQDRLNEMETFSVTLTLCSYYWPRVRWISLRKDQWYRALIFSLMLAWTKCWTLLPVIWYTPWRSCDVSIMYRWKSPAVPGTPFANMD